MNKSIELSRRGYAYQDKYALLQLLKFLCDGRIKKFDIEIPFGDRGNSLDILIILQNPEEKHIYEVKTGEEFKKSKWKELSNTLKVLYSFDGKKNECQKHIVVSPKFRSEIAEHWSNLLLIHDRRKDAKNNRGETMEGIARFQKNKFGFVKISLKEFITFIKSLKIESGFSYERRKGMDRFSDLEDAIESEVKNLISKLEIEGSELAIPCWNIALDLLELVRQCAEGRTEIISAIIESLVNAFARRSIISNQISDEDLKNKRTEIAKKLSNITKISHDISKFDYNKIKEGSEASNY